MKPLLAALALVPALAFGQTANLVSLDARGDDVREVFATLFAQAHRPYALDASIKGKLYVTLDRMPFSKALNVVLTQANLVAKEQDGVTLIVPAPKPAAPKTAAPKPVASPKPVVMSVPKPLEKTSKPTSIAPSVLAHRVTTRLSRASLTDVFSALGEQAGVPIEVDPSVPAYRIDAFFVKTSLRYALDRICKAAGLRYEPSVEGIRIVKGA